MCAVTRPACARGARPRNSPGRPRMGVGGTPGLDLGGLRGRRGGSGGGAPSRNTPPSIGGGEKKKRPATPPLLSLRKTHLAPASGWKSQSPCAPRTRTTCPAPGRWAWSTAGRTRAAAVGPGVGRKREREERHGEEQEPVQEPVPPAARGRPHPAATAQRTWSGAHDPGRAPGGTVGVGIAGAWGARAGETGGEFGRRRGKKKVSAALIPRYLKCAPPFCRPRHPPLHCAAARRGSAGRRARGARALADGRQCLNTALMEGQRCYFLSGGWRGEGRRGALAPHSFFAFPPNNACPPPAGHEAGPI